MPSMLHWPQQGGLGVKIQFSAYRAGCPVAYLVIRPVCMYFDDSADHSAPHLLARSGSDKVLNGLMCRYICAPSRPVSGGGFIVGGGHCSTSIGRPVRVKGLPLGTNARGRVRHHSGSGGGWVDVDEFTIIGYTLPHPIRTARIISNMT